MKERAQYNSPKLDIIELVEDVILTSNTQSTDDDGIKLDQVWSLLMKKKTLLLALIPALLLAPSCSATNTTGGMKAHDVVIKNETTNDKYGEKPALLKEGRRNLEATTASIDDVAVSTSSKDGDLILTFAISESLESVLLAANVTTVSVYYGYVAYENDAVSNDVVLAHGAKIDYDLANGRIIRLIIKDRGTADYADKKYQGVLTYTLNETQYVSETQSISQTWTTTTDNLTNALAKRYNVAKPVLTEVGENKYNGQDTYELVGIADKWSGVSVTIPQLEGNYANAKLSFVMKAVGAKQSLIAFKLTDDDNKNISSSVSDAKCSPVLDSNGVTRTDLGGDWYGYTLDFSTAFGVLQVAQVLEAAHAEFVFTSQDTTTTPYVYIANMRIEYPNKASLPRAQLTLNDNVLTWDAVRSAESYTVFEDGVEVAALSKDDALTYTCANDENGCHRLQVVASPDNRGYYTRSESDVVIRKIGDEAAETTDLSNRFESLYNCQISEDSDDFHIGTKSVRFSSITTSGSATIPVSCLDGMIGKTITFYTKVIDHSQMVNQYVHLTFAYLDAKKVRTGNAVTQYLNFGAGDHSNSLGTVEKLGNTGWNRNTFALDDSAFSGTVEKPNPVDWENVAYLRLQVSEVVAFDIDGMTVTDTLTA
ncbi:MAG: hypothetical protein II494_05875 [Bacilli bacterium]|nr:hypothetical protein [Bacilli bacterium]